MAPGLAVIHVQHVKESSIYVQKKKDACKQCGIQDFSVTLPNAISQESLIKVFKHIILRDSRFDSMSE